MEIPDYIEPVYGWRTWVVRRGGILGAVSTSVKWPLGEVFKATCNIRGEHEAPVEGCQCGIYATQGVEEPFKYTDRYFHNKYVVLGVVALWGKVIVGTNGWKAEHCYPHALWVLCPSQELVRRPFTPSMESLDGGAEEKLRLLVDWLWRHYQVPVRLFPRTEDGFLNYTALKTLTGSRITAPEMHAILESLDTPQKTPTKLCPEWMLYTPYGPDEDWDTLSKTSKWAGSRNTLPGGYLPYA